MHLDKSTCRTASRTVKGALCCSPVFVFLVCKGQPGSTPHTSAAFQRSRSFLASCSMGCTRKLLFLEALQV